MEKLTTLKNKVSKLLPTALVAGAMLNCASAFANPAKLSKENLNQSPKNTYSSMAANFEADDSAFIDLYKSPLNNMKGYERLEVDVQNEVAKHLVNISNDAINLAAIREAAEKEIFANANMTFEEMMKIAECRGQGYPDQKNIVVGRWLNSHFTHVYMRSLSGVAYGAEYAEFNAMDENDNKNEYIRFDVKGERSIHKEVDSILNFAINDVLGYVGYAEELKGNNPDKARADFNNDYAALKNLLTLEHNDENLSQILNLVDSMAHKLPADFFGTLRERRVHMLCFAEFSSASTLLKDLEAKNYDVSMIKAGRFEKALKTKFEGFTADADFTNENAVVTAGANFKTMFNNKFSLSYGPRLSISTTYSDGDVATRLAGNVTPNFNINDKHTISVPTEVGMEFGGKDGASAVLSTGVNYLAKINKNLELGATTKVTGILNPNVKSVEVVGGPMARIWFNNGMNLAVRTTGGFKKTVRETQNLHTSSIPNIIPSDPTKPVPVITGTDKGHTTSILTPYDPEKLH